MKRKLTAGVGGAEPEDGQVLAQVLDLGAEEGGVGEGRVGCHPDQVVLKLGRHYLVLLQGETVSQAKRRNFKPSHHGVGGAFIHASNEAVN